MRMRKGEVLISVSVFIAAVAIAAGILWLCSKVGNKIDTIPDWVPPLVVIVITAAVSTSLYKRIKG